MSTEPRDIEWTAVDITDHVQRFKLDSGELFIEKSAYQALEQKLAAAIEALELIANGEYQDRDVLCYCPKQAREALLKIKGKT